MVECIVMKQPTVYLLASQRNGTLYIGVTGDLIQRIWQHRTNAVEGFTKKHHVHPLVWFEQHPSMESAITCEKALKKWKRAWKLDLIEKFNPDWKDLWPIMNGWNPEIQAVKKRLDPRIREGDERERGWRKRRASVTKATMGRPLSVIPA